MVHYANGAIARTVIFDSALAAKVASGTLTESTLASSRLRLGLQKIDRLTES